MDLPKIRFIPKKERERRAKEEAERKEAKKREEEQARKEEAQRRKAELEEKTRKRKRDEAEEENQRVRGSLPPRPVPRPGEKMTAEEIEIESQYLKYFGPEINKFSRFNPNKKKRNAKEFNFDWDPMDDTTIRDPEKEAAIKRATKLATVSPDADLPPEFDYNSEIEVLVRAEGFRLHVPNGEQRAKEHLDRFYAGRRAAIERASRDKKRYVHWSEKPLKDMTERDWRILKENSSITIKGSNLPNPMRRWNESGLPPRILDVLQKRRFHDPTPIQQAAIPIALTARDLLGVAKTGSGKTLAFILPLLVYISDLPPITEYNASEGPYALILVPTRELAQQIEKEARDFAEQYGFRIVTIVGGHKMEEQGIALQGGAHIIVATPGRLIDCIERRLVVFERCCYLIMDEADRMIDLGFEEPVNRILSALPATNEKPDSNEALDTSLMRTQLGRRNKYRQTMMFTATMPPQVEKMAEKYLRKPATVTVGQIGEAVDTVEQRVEFITGEKKRLERLEQILADPKLKSPVIIFVNIKLNCDVIAKAVKNMGWRTATLHGGKTQQQREQALDNVKKGIADVLVATDLAGRGIDVPDVSLVVNFNMAPSIEAYTHRIGRTGRAGKSGLAITFLGSEDADVMYDLKMMISRSPVSKLPDELARHEAAQHRSRRRN